MMGVTPPATTPSSEKSGSTVSVFSSPSGMSTPSTRLGGAIIPDHWQPEIESCLKEECLTDSARNEIVRSLVNQLFARASKPTRSQCEKLARKLILKHPFVKDDMGNGYVSILQHYGIHISFVLAHVTMLQSCCSYCVYCMSFYSLLNSNHGQIRW